MQHSNLLLIAFSIFAIRITSEKLQVPLQHGSDARERSMPSNTFMVHNWWLIRFRFYITTGHCYALKINNELNANKRRSRWTRSVSYIDFLCSSKTPYSPNKQLIRIIFKTDLSPFTCCCGVGLEFQWRIDNAF